MSIASILSILAHATPTPTSRPKGQKSKSRGGAYCGGHLAAQLVVAAISQWHRRLYACVTAHGGHLEHIVWCLHGSVHMC